MKVELDKRGKNNLNVYEFLKKNETEYTKENTELLGEIQDLITNNGILLKKKRCFGTL